MPGQENTGGLKAWLVDAPARVAGRIRQIRERTGVNEAGGRNNSATPPPAAPVAQRDEKGLTRPGNAPAPHGSASPAPAAPLPTPGGEDSEGKELPSPFETLRQGSAADATRVVSRGVSTVADKHHAPPSTQVPATTQPPADAQVPQGIDELASALRTLSELRTLIEGLPAALRHVTEAHGKAKDALAEEQAARQAEAHRFGDRIRELQVAAAESEVQIAKLNRELANAQKELAALRASERERTTALMPWWRRQKRPSGAASPSSRRTRSC